MSKIGKYEWLIVGGIMLIIDIIQEICLVFEVALALFGVGEVILAINEGADPFIGIILIAYFQKRGVNMLHHWKRAASMLAVCGLDEITGGGASLWVLDIWYLHHSVKSEEAVIKAQEEEMALLENAIRQPVNIEDENGNGIRRPPVIANYSTPENPANMNGVRAPNGGLN